MNWLIARLKERSTWLALFTFAGLFGMQIEPELRDKLMDAILAVAALIAFIFRESIREPHQPDQIPEIELQGRSESPVQPEVDSLSSGVESFGAHRNGGISGGQFSIEHQRMLQANLQSKPNTQSPGWNG